MRLNPLFVVCHCWAAEMRQKVRMGVVVHKTIRNQVDMFNIKNMIRMKRTLILSLLESKRYFFVSNSIELHLL